MTDAESEWLDRSFEAVKHDTVAVGGSWEPARIVGHAHRQAKRIAYLKTHLTYARTELQFIADNRECCTLMQAVEAAGNGLKACDLSRDFVG